VIAVDGAEVRTITFSGPDGNVLDLHDLAALEQATREAATDDAVAVIVLTGANGAFSTGARVEDLDDENALTRMTELLTAVVVTLADAPQPVIARVDGDAIGGGLALVGAADLAIASPGSRVALPEARYGLVATVAIDAIAAKVGQATLLDLVLTGRALSAAAAHVAGLFSEVAPEGGLDDVVAARLRQLARGERNALAASKARVRQAAKMHAPVVNANVAIESAALLP
jgi:enoyl-CoA hydratase/carnithine racemase